MNAKNILFNIVYIPIMKRWGDDEGHHYLLGAYSTIEAAIEAAKQNREHRGGKYEWVIEAYEVNAGPNSHNRIGMHRVAKSEEMNCLIDKERDSVLKSKSKWAEYYEKCEQSKLKTRQEELIKELAAIRRIMK